MQLLRLELAKTTAICVGRRAGLEPYFERHFELIADPKTGLVTLREKT